MTRLIGMKASARVSIVSKRSNHELSDARSDAYPALFYPSDERDIATREDGTFPNLHTLVPYARDNRPVYFLGTAKDETRNFSRGARAHLVSLAFKASVQDTALLLVPG